MWLVLCQPRDESASWVCEGLRRRGLDPVELLSADVLGRATRWVHHLSSQSASVTFELPDGRRVESSSVHGAINRLRWIPADVLTSVTEEDREYATHELQAFHLGWLRSLPGQVVNRPTPRGLSGAWRHSSEWAVMASRSGLDVNGFILGSSDCGALLSCHGQSPQTEASRMVYVVGGQTVGDELPPEISDACRRLSVLARDTLLGVRFEIDDDGDWVFDAATPWPDLRPGGEQLLDRLASVLEGNA